MNASAPLEPIEAACTHLEHIASVEMQVPLTRTLGGIKVLEEIVSGLTSFTTDEAPIRGATFMAGAYLGEILRAQIGGEWQATGDGELVLVVQGSAYFPIVRVRQFAAERQEVGALTFYAQAAIALHGGHG